MIDITSLHIECDRGGGTKVTAWVKCFTSEDLDDTVAWLGLARSVMTDWAEICVSTRNKSHGVVLTTIKKNPGD